MTTERIAPKYPIEVQLSAVDGNAFMLLGTVQKALRKAGVSADERAVFMRDATAGDYDHLVQTCMRWVEVS